MRNLDAVAIVEAAYRLDLTEEQWLQQLAEVADARLGDGLGASAYINEGNRRRLRASVGTAAEHEGVIQEIESNIPDDIGEKLFRLVGCLSGLETAEQYLGMDRATVQAMYRATTPTWGFEDVLNVQGADPLGPSVTLTVPRRSVVSLAPAERHSWCRVAAHLTTALRLREGLGDIAVLERASAIFDADGQCQHATGDAQPAAARDQLRAAIKTIDRIRSREDNAADLEALQLWKGLVDGKWSVLDQFDSDGRRFVVAIENEPQVAMDRALTRRERQAVDLVAIGYSDQIAAYALGLSTSSIRTHIDRSLSKLGLTSRLDLFKLRNRLLHESRTPHLGQQAST